ncbi:hypothetical protein Q3O59_12080 [Alkalimonas delamerensis]|uniref:DUF2509 family protein n=1 Tax=Alkalimonas delamerensis TaxID=265981 RepID=A0ABT9GS03_9GAMM|nr:hypothetical protein [Alkalimonas delamerensis]MDP4529761.1 hypothetical protein [Alkalimonas delamerensis]
MKSSKGFALITTLLLATVMVLLVLALLQSSQLSLRIADAGQQALQVRQQAWQQHLQQQVAVELTPLVAEVACPPLYAAWQAEQLVCQRYLKVSSKAQEHWLDSQAASLVMQIQLQSKVKSDD